MSNYITGTDMVNGVLEICGELTDGSSLFQTRALKYLNLAWRGVLTGGNIYGIDVAEPWTWALAKRPLVLTLQPNIQNVNVSTTQGSYNVTFSTPPQNVLLANISVKGWWINIDSRDEWFQIQSHTSGSTTAQLDVPYTESSLTAATCNMVLLDYDLIDNSVVVDSTCNRFNFSEGSGVALGCGLTNGIYTPQAFATMVAASMTAAGTQTYSMGFDVVSRQFGFTAPGIFNLLNVLSPTMPYTTASTMALMGFDMLDYTGGKSYVGTVPLNAINRLTSPMLCYRKSNTSWSGPKNEGKIYEISVNTFTREYPLSMMRAGVPDRYCVTNTSDSGIVSVRFNSYMYQLPTKVEIGYIPKQRDLQFNAYSIPSLPEEHRKYLVDAAAGMLLHDKVDSRRTEREGIAKAGLQALVHSHRKSLSVAGIDYGKLVARPGQTKRNWRWWQIT